jgi:hypothetical protein
VIVSPVEDLDRGPELRSRVAPPPGAAQPFPVAKVRACVLEDNFAPRVERERMLEMSLEVVSGEDAPAPLRPGGGQRIVVVGHLSDEFRQ